MERLVNLTPHAIAIRTSSGEDVTLTPDGRIARMDEQRFGEFTLAGLEVVDVRVLESVDLPEPEPEVWFVVSLIVALAGATRRDDLLTPDTSPGSAIRDGGGVIVAVRRLRRVVA